MSNYEKCGAVDTQALQISILEHELAEAKDQYQMERARADQLGVNCTWLIHQFDQIHTALGLEFTGTWQDRVKQVVEKSTQTTNAKDCINTSLADGGTVRLWCGYCRRKQQHRLNGIGMLICRACGRYRDMPNGAAHVRSEASNVEQIVGETCDTCSSQEGRHYCLLHSQQMKNMDTYKCEDWTQKE